MKKASIILLSALMLTACGGTDTSTSNAIDSSDAGSAGVDNVANPTSANSAEGSAGNVSDNEILSANSVIGGKITLLNGADQSSAITVTLRGSDISSAMQANGEFELELLKADAERTVVLDVSGASVIPTSVSVKVPAQAPRVSVDAMLAGRTTPITFNLEAGGELKNPTSDMRVSVSVPANAFEFSDGSAATGDAQVSITEIDIQDLYGDSAWAPNLIGIAEGMSEPSAIYSFGMSDFHFSQNGRDLQLRTGVEATLKMDLLAPFTTTEDEYPVRATAGAVLPLWHYDTEDMIWKEEGEAVVVADNDSAFGFSASGNVSHFSTWNIDKLTPQMTVSVELQLIDENGQPYTELNVASWHTTARIPLEDGAGWGNAYPECTTPCEPEWVNRSSMTPSSNRILVLANTANREQSIANKDYVTGFATMEFVIENVQVTGDGFGEVSSAPVTGRKIFRDFDGDDSIVLQVVVTEPTPTEQPGTVVVELVDLFGNILNELVVESYTITTETDSEKYPTPATQTVVTPNATGGTLESNINILANDEKRIAADETITTTITLSNVVLEEYGEVDMLVPVEEEKVFKTFDDGSGGTLEEQNTVTLQVVVTDL